MLKRMIGVFTAVATALLVVGVAWAGGDDAARIGTGSSVAASTPEVSLAADTAATASAQAGEVTSSTVEDSVTSATVVEDGVTSTIGATETSTTVDQRTTSTAVDDSASTSTTLDDGEEETAAEVSIVGERTFQVEGAGHVTVAVVASRLVLVDVAVRSGWSYRVEKANGDQVEVRFRSGESEAEFEAELDHGGIRIEIETKS